MVQQLHQVLNSRNPSILNSSFMSFFLVHETDCKASSKEVVLHKN